MKPVSTLLQAAALAMFLLPAPPCRALTVGEALDTPDRHWLTGGEGSIIPVLSANQSPDDVDSVHIQTNPGPGAAWLETEVMLPCYFSIQGKGIAVSLGNGVAQYGLPEIAITPSNPNGFNSLRRILTGNGPARVKFTAFTSFAVLDAVDFEEPDGRLVPMVALGDPPLTWALYGGQPWQVVPREATGLDRYRSRLDVPLWMETVVNGPGRLGVIDGTLPDRENRPFNDGWISFPGPQRVLVNRSAGSLLSTSSFQATAPIDTWAGAPALSWTTGGAAPWQSTMSGTVRSGLVWPGEVSWIEASAQGPGVLYWDSDGGSVLCNGTDLPSTSKRGWLHLAAGPHRIRWQIANPQNGLRDDTSVVTLKNVAFSPQPDQSVSSVLSSGALTFLEVPPSDFESNATAPLPWPSPIGWRLVEDSALPGPAVQGEYTSGSLTAVLPAPGRLATMLKMDGATYPGAVIPTSGPATSAPFSWSAWTIAPRLPQGDGFRTLAAQSAFVPHPSVTIGEAIERPDTEWSAGSEPPGLWLPLEDPTSTSVDKDGLYLRQMAMTDRAWLQTTLTGPARVTFGISGFRSDTNAGVRILMDEMLVFTGKLFSSSGLPVHVPAGTHTLRFEFLAHQPARTHNGLSVSTVAITPLEVPAVPDLLDAPGLAWAATGTGTLSSVTTGTHDGVDALGLARNQLAVGVLGPGILNFWIKGADSFNAIALDTWPVPVTSASSSTWVPYSIPIPQGRHSLLISGGSNTVVDEMVFQPLTALSAAEALDAPPEVAVLIPEPESVGAAAYPGFSEDGADSLLMMPGATHPFALQVPPLSQISLRVRAAFSAGTFGFQDLPSRTTSTTWATHTFSTQTEGGQNVIYFRARSVPVLLDKLTVTSSSATAQYFPWAQAAGLTSSQQDVSADPDHDGLTNFAEYSHGLDPAVPDAHRLGTDTVPGLPDVTTFTHSNGSQYLEVRYWRRGLLAAHVETAITPSGAALLGQPDGWTTSTHPPHSTSQLGDWTRVVWRSPNPIAPGTRLFARVRTFLP